MNFSALGVFVIVARGTLIILVSYSVDMLTATVQRRLKKGYRKLRYGSEMRRYRRFAGCSSPTRVEHGLQPRMPYQRLCQQTKYSSILTVALYPYAKPTRLCRSKQFIQRTAAESKHLQSVRRPSVITSQRSSARKDGV